MQGCRLAAATTSEFKHNDPVGWTEAHRGQIMRALYTLLLGNPFLRTPMGTEASTRFKIWWRMCGSAVARADAEGARPQAVTGRARPGAGLEVRRCMNSDSAPRCNLHTGRSFCMPKMPTAVRVRRLAEAQTLRLGRSWVKDRDV